MGVGANAVNETISSNSLLNTAGALALSFGQALGTIEINKFAQQNGSFVVATGDPSHPVAAIPGSQIQLAAQQQQLQQQSLTSWVVIGLGGLLVLLVVLAVLKK